MIREDAYGAERQFSFTNQFTSIEILQHSTDCKILLDSADTKSFISNNTISENKFLHRYLKLSTKAQVIQVDKGGGVNIFFIVPIFIIIQGHLFEICTMVS